MLQTMRTNKKGFTLVELLVVLVIIAILAAVATPLYLRHTRRARASEAVATMSLIRQAERDQFINANLFVEVAEGALDDPLPPLGNGLDINLGIPQYFCSDAYSVEIDGEGDSGLFTTPDEVDFVIKVDPTVCSEDCADVTATDCAVKAEEVNGAGEADDAYLLEMDNSGRIFVRYNATDGWEAY